MSLTIDTTAGTAHSAESRPDAAARVCAAWAASGEFDEYLVYERDSRWVFAAGVRARVVLNHHTIDVTDGDRRTSTSWTGDPAAAIAHALAELSGQWRVYGWVAFDFCAARHDLFGHVSGDAHLAHLIVPEFEVVVTDDGIDTGDLDPRRADRLRAIADAVTGPPPATPVDVGDDADDYRGRVALAVDEIARGEYQKVILSRRVDIVFDVDLPATFVRGREANDPARSYLFHIGELSAAGFSPELVVAADTDGRVVTEPLAGTRAAGRGADLDAAARAELLTDPKEIAEHAMSVRACFDEISSVSIPGTTAVHEYMAIRERGSVQHLASTVGGDLSPDAGVWQALSVLFPSITASGIPKAPALDAIYRLEPGRRGLYSGAVLTASSAGDLEATLALRTVFSAGGTTWLRAGAGVVAQSTPDREFEETCEKLGSVAPHVVRRGEGGR
ncbi:salicylate synthase [Gordonia sp. LSe1-13]|uniref:Salicylate synthase n=1 Tax=Gordonia sesuvii TaxID=3116777 RepID=A0ABU7MA87_9ACTN|nr:salicylate synthase [Gordonia sp. LSe1-13]